MRSECVDHKRTHSAAQRRTPQPADLSFLRIAAHRSRPHRCSRHSAVRCSCSAHPMRTHDSDEWGARLRADDRTAPLCAWPNAAPAEPHEPHGSRFLPPPLCPPALTHHTPPSRIASGPAALLHTTAAAASMYQGSKDRSKASGSRAGDSFWTEEQNNFGMKMMKGMGWEQGKGLGKNEDGQKQYLRAKYKADAKGECAATASAAAAAGAQVRRPQRNRRDAELRASRLRSAMSSLERRRFDGDDAASILPHVRTLAHVPSFFCLLLPCSAQESVRLRSKRTRRGVPLRICSLRCFSA
jgi:hypothetical protein